MRMLRGCPECGATWREPTARFCGTCGARLIDRPDDTPTRLGRVRLPTATQRSRILVGVIVTALVAAAVAWAASRPPRIQEIDVAVPGPTELQEPPDRQSDVPRCVVGGLEHNCVTWELDARAVSAQRHGKLLVFLTRDGAVKGIFPDTGEIAWATNTPVVNGGLHPAAPSGRVLVVGNNRVSILDAGTGRVVGDYQGWSGPYTDERLAILAGDPDGQRITIVDWVTGQTDEWRIGHDEHLLDIGDPPITMQYEESHDHVGLEIRAYGQDGQVAWSMPDIAAPLGTGPLLYVAMQPDEVTRESEVRAIDRTTGSIVWTRRITDPESASWGLGGSQGTAVSEGVVLVYDEAELYALEARTGEERWRAASPHESASLSSVERPGEIVLSVWSLLGQNQLIGLDADTGKTLWTGPTLENEWWDPSLVTPEGLLASSGRRHSIHHYDGTVTSFTLMGARMSVTARIVSLDPLVVSSGIRLYGLDAEVALSGVPTPRASE